MYRKLKGKLKKEKGDLEKANKELEKANKELEEVNKELEEVKGELNKANEANNALTDELNGFKSEQAMFQVFMNLNTAVKDALKSIFKQDTYENFLACGTQLGNINALWNVIKCRVQNGQFDELEELSKILYYFIDVFNTIEDKPLLKVQDVSDKHNFDVEYFIKSEDSSKQMGAISKVYLKGYCNVVSGKIINKSIVKVGE